MCHHKDCPGVPYCPPDLRDGDLEFLHESPALIRMPIIPNPAFSDPRGYGATVELLRTRKAALVEELRATVRDQRRAIERITTLMAALDERILLLTAVTPTRAA